MTIKVKDLEGKEVWVAYAYFSTNRGRIINHMKPTELTIRNVVCKNEKNVYFEFYNKKNKKIRVSVSNTLSIYGASVIKNELGELAIDLCILYETEDEAREAYNSAILNAIDYVTSDCQSKIKYLNSKLL